MDNLKENSYKNLFTYNKSVNEVVINSLEFINKDINLNYFYYGKFIENSKFFLCSNLQYLKHILCNELFASRYSTFQKMVDGMQKNDTRKFIWTGDPPDKAHQVLYDYDIWNGYTHYERTDDCLEVWGFGTSRENSVLINFYLNYEHILRDHIFYLKDKFSFLFDVSNSQKLIPSLLTFSDKPTVTLHQDFESENSIKKYYLTGNLSLSKRQAECVIASIRGKSSKEIARELGLSPRSVEKYLENLKYKMGCASMRETIEKLFELESVRHLIVRPSPFK